MSLRIDAVILAGGQARRMGGQDKGLVELIGKPMIEHAIDRIRPQVKEILINANRNQSRYALYSDTVFGDDDSGFLGPLAGMVAAMGKTQADLLLVVPCDCPCLPTDLVPRLKAAMDAADADVAVASDGEYEQPVVMLLKPSLRDSMKAFLDAGERKIDFWYAKHKVAVESFADQPNAFVNVNTPEQVEQLTQALTQ
ncbi:molybdenum cofactor guanylyltransferase [Shewanella sp. JM162201]|uniref:Molybdenum cofactor guanylyltransferase n=1 Tax=Shewanella jiangmenensis TaxID=2837387 RepID=A0ABS5V6R5_9GAMM|nr:molybdenum cofactor guanylyltransferase MobA [Shewanella jiangmenensis]MBT1446129.1 molybdenum cofactor guanylyltransferase [Shewanella jiangmenensis]